MSLAPAEIQARYQAVRAQVDEATRRAGRQPAEVTVVAVSKAQPLEAVRAAAEAGCLDFGENRVQEWAEKAPALPRRLRWHFIGPLQSNKVRVLADEVTLIHSIDREKLVRELERRAQSPHGCLIEVNVGGEAHKSGVAPAALPALLARCAESAIVRPVGLMCIPPYTPDAEGARPYYRRLAELFAQARAQLVERDAFLAEDFVHLSMGMSHDFAVAIAEGATLVRIGTGIFGERPTGGGA